MPLNHNNDVVLFKRNHFLLAVCISEEWEECHAVREMQRFSNASRWVQKRTNHKKRKQTGFHWRWPTGNSYKPRQIGSNFTLQAWFCLSTWLFLDLFRPRQVSWSLPPSWLSIRFCSQSLLFNKAHLEQGVAELTTLGLQQDFKLVGCFRKRKLVHDTDTSLQCIFFSTQQYVCSYIISMQDLGTHGIYIICLWADACLNIYTLLLLEGNSCKFSSKKTRLGIYFCLFCPLSLQV